MEKINLLIRIANILEDVENIVGSVSPEHNQVIALILLDYCNETMLKAIHYHLLLREGDKMFDCWKHIDKELKANKKNTGLSELPYKTEILNIIHKKRNFVQHSGESPKVEEVLKYLAYTKLFIDVVTKEILGEDIKSISSANLINNPSYRFLIEKANAYNKTDPMLAGAFVACAISYAEGLFRDQWSDVDENLGWRISHLFEDNNLFKRDSEKLFSDMGERIDTNTN